MIVFITLFIITLIVSFIPYFLKFENKIWLNFLLSFSGSYLLGITLLHIIPELYENHASTFQVGIFVMLGFFIQVILESYSKGMEHGHVHIHDFGKMPYGLLIALSLHALLEGSALNSTFEHNLEIVFGILIHKIPVAFLLGFLFYSIKTNVIKSIVLLSLFAICTPVGGLISSSFQFQLFGLGSNQLLLAMATGSFLHVSTTILFETSPDHKLKISKFIPALLGGVLAISSSLLLHHH